jgi:hypothetical protein
MNYPTRDVAGAFDEAKFAELANSVFHEARHAEQYFRVARLMAAENKSAAEIERNLDIPQDVAQRAVANPLNPRQQREWAEARRWRDNLLTDAKSLTAAMQEAETRLGGLENALDAYHDPGSNERFRQHYNALMANPNGPQEWLAFGNDIYQRYEEARENYEKAYPRYATMPVEADAWARGCGMERRLVGRARTALNEWAERLSDDSKKAWTFLLVNPPLRLASPAPPDRPLPLPPIPSAAPPRSHQESTVKHRHRPRTTCRLRPQTATRRRLNRSL